MKVLRYNRQGEPHSVGRLGCIVEHDVIADLRACYARYLTEVAHDSQAREIARLRFPPHVVPFLQIGTAAWRALAAARPWIEALYEKDPGALGLDHEPLFIAYRDCYVHIASRPSKLVCVRWNYGRSRKDPRAIIKSNASVMGPQRKIAKPAAVKELDFGVNLGVVISTKCKNVPEVNAYDVVAGYTLVNDLIARDEERSGREFGGIGLGDFRDTFTPIGPWLVTRDEVPDPMSLRITASVNDELRQDANTSEMRNAIPELIAMLSRTTLEPGDVIATGTPEHLPLSDESKRFLDVGDVVQCTIESIGTLDNQVAAEASGASH